MGALEYVSEELKNNREFVLAVTQGSQDQLGKFYNRAIRALDQMDSTPITKPLNYIESLDENLQRYISEFLSPCESYDWELACQGEEILALIEEEYDEDNTRDLAR